MKNKKDELWMVVQKLLIHFYLSKNSFIAINLQLNIMIGFRTLSRMNPHFSCATFSFMKPSLNLIFLHYHQKKSEKSNEHSIKIENPQKAQPYTYECESRLPVYTWDNSFSVTKIEA